MARNRQRTPELPKGLIASAVNLPTVIRNQAGTAAEWQTRAWDYYDTVGELRFVANWVGSIMSRALLLPVTEQDGKIVVVEDGPAREAMEALYDGVQGQQEMLRATGVHLTVSGECYHANIDDNWHVLGTGKVTQRSGNVEADVGTGRKEEISTSDLVYRVWTPHPQDPYMAESPVRANMSTLAEIRSLSDHVQAQLTSRLAGAGILWIPNDISFPKPKEADPNASDVDVFMSVLGEAMTTPIQDRSNASAVVPIVAQVPSEDINNIKHTTFWTELDAVTNEMRDAAIKRLALGLDTPPEVLLGIADTNHWNAWLIDEASVKAHIEPRLQVVAHAITEAYLQPAIQGLVANPTDYMVLADTSAIRLRPNRSREAIELYDRGELSGDSLRRETGFQNNDAPREEEFVEWLLRRIASGSTSPEQTAAALKALGVSLPDTPERDTDSAEPPPQVRPTERNPELPRNEPDRERSRARQESQPALVAASEVLVFRALERAGNRLCDAKARKQGLGDVPAHKRYMDARGSADSLLEGAWTCATDVLDGLHDDPDEVVSLLDFYVRGLLSTQRPHSRNTLTTLLERTLVS